MFTKFTKIKPFCPTLALILTLLFASSSVAATGNEALMERAKNLYGIQEYNHALVLFEKLLEAEPENGEAWDYASWCHRYLGNLKQARHGFREAEKYLPGALAKWVKVGMGETYLGGGLRHSAIQAFSQAIELAPEDDELVTRSMKGIILAHAALGDTLKTGEALARLRDRDPAAAAEIEPDAEVLLEIYRKPEAPAPKADDVTEVTEEIEEPEYEPEIAVEEPDSLTDAIDRRQTAADQAARPDEPLQKPADETPPPHRETAVAIWDLAVGEPIRSVLDDLSEKGIEVQKVEESTKLGSWFYTAQFPGSPLPELMRQDADSILCYLEEFQGKLLTAGVSITWRGRKHGSIYLKEEVFKEVSGNLNAKYGPSTNYDNNGISAETYWVPDDKRFIVLDATASLDGQVILNVSLSDLPGLSVFWEHAQRINTQ